MGGRGSYAAGNNPAYTFETVGTIEGVKVLKGINGIHGLPEESHSSSAYIQLYQDGTFKEMRIYDENHYLIKEIAYHPEAKLNNGNRIDKILHVHDYQPNNFETRSTRLLTKAEIDLYKKYLKGVKLS